MKGLIMRKIRDFAETVILTPQFVVVYLHNKWLKASLRKTQQKRNKYLQ